MCCSRCRINYLDNMPKRSGFFWQASWALLVTSVQLRRAAGVVPCSRSSRSSKRNNALDFFNYQLTRRLSWCASTLR